MILKLNMSLTNVSLTCITKLQQMSTVTYRGGREQCQQLSPFDLNIFLFYKNTNEIGHKFHNLERPFLL